MRAKMQAKHDAHKLQRMVKQIGIFEDNLHIERAADIDKKERDKESKADIMQLLGQVAVVLEKIRKHEPYDNYNIASKVLQRPLPDFPFFH